MKITFLGHAAVLLEGDHFKALIDPYLNGNPVYKENKNDISDITHIFITHGHIDHVGDTLEIAKNCDSLIICNAELAGIFYKKNPGLKLHPMHIGGRFHFDFGRVKMTPALHGSSYHDGDQVLNAGNPGGFLIEVEGKVIYHAGDTGLTLDMKLLESENVDLAFIPIGGNYTMDPKDALKAVDFIKPKIVVPIHYNTFSLIKADPVAFKEQVENAETIIMKPRDSIEL